MSLDNRTCFTVNLRDRLQCTLCKKEPEAKDNYHRGFEYHHVLPRSQGGGDEAGNIVLLCHACHLQQHRGTPEKLTLPAPAPDRFACKACATTLNPQTVEMNCGWYRCDECHAQTHLFDHFQQL